MQITDEQLIEELKKRFDNNRATVKELRFSTQQLLEVNRKLRESEEMKSHFLSNITNEIINPFTSIIGLAKYISECKPSEWDIMKNMANLIYEESSCLNFQLQNIFAASEIEAGKLSKNISKINIKNLVEEAIESFNYVISQKKQTVNLKSAEELYFYSDADKLLLTITNLISNAINFTEEQGYIEIKVEKRNNKLIFTIYDNGIGIQGKDRQIIFDRFKRLNTEINSINRGHGLGLSVTKAYVEFLDGQIKVADNFKKGSIFTITIPEEDITTIVEDDSELYFDDAEIF